MEGLLTFFIALTALAVITQAVVLIGIYVSMRKIVDKVDEAKRSIRSHSELIDNVREMVTASRAVAENLRSASSHLADISASAQEQFRRVEDMIGEAGDALRAQLEKLDRAATDVVERVGETADIIQQSVIQPVREVSALAKGLTRGLETFLARKHRSTVDQARQDEELFI